MCALRAIQNSVQACHSSDLTRSTLSQRRALTSCFATAKSYVKITSFGLYLFFFGLYLFFNKNNELVFQIQFNIWCLTTYNKRNISTELLQEHHVKGILSSVLHRPSTTVSYNLPFPRDHRWKTVRVLCFVLIKVYR